MADGSDPTRLSPARSMLGDPKVFVLRRELSEVHLLLDNISSNPEKVLPLAQTKHPGDLDADWLRKICEIEWPPGGDELQEAAQVELLIRAKDYLNTLAKPASGLTIAFTHLVTQEPDGPRADAAMQAEDAPSRGSLASAAYPDLADKARRFRRGMWWISGFLFGWLVLTCLVSWYVAFGNAELAQRAAAQAAYDAAEKRVDALQSPTVATETNGKPSDVGDHAAPDQGKSVSSSNAGGADLDPIDGSKPADLPLACPAVRSDIPDEADAGPYSTISQRQSCRELHRARVARAVADVQVAHWTFHGAKVAGQGLSGWASALANILGTAILPVLYGILGAGAAVLRSLSRKMRLSLLAPRDLNLSIQQLALGAVMGACIGIFIAQPSSADSAASTVIGPVALSASALSFISGFGVDAVFATLESVIARIFNVQAAGTTNAATGSVHS